MITEISDETTTTTTTTKQAIVGCLNTDTPFGIGSPSASHCWKLERYTRDCVALTSKHPVSLNAWENKSGIFRSFLREELSQ